MGERGLRGVAALVGTRLGVGSFVSWTLLLARINLLPPPLAPTPPSPSTVPSSAIPPRAKRGVRVAPGLSCLAVAAPRDAGETAHADSANHPRRPLRSRGNPSRSALAAASVNARR